LGLVSAGTIQALTNAGITVAPNSDLHVRWAGADISGGGNRDEFGIDNVSVTLAAGAELVATSTTLDDIEPLTVNVGQAVTFEGTVVAASGTDTPTGSVEIRDGGSTGTLLASTTEITGFGAHGAFAFSSTSVPAGTFSAIQAFYLPGPGFEASVSTVYDFTLNVNSSPPTLDPNRGLTLNPGQKVIIGAAILSGQRSGQRTADVHPDIRSHARGIAQERCLARGGRYVYPGRSGQHRRLGSAKLHQHRNRTGCG
jgi:hypothetical protein